MLNATFSVIFKLRSNGPNDLKWMLTVKCGMRFASIFNHIRFGFCWRSLQVSFGHININSVILADVIFVMISTAVMFMPISVMMFVVSMLSILILLLIMMLVFPHV